MTRKDYVLIANAIACVKGRSQLEHEGRTLVTINSIVEEFAHRLQGDNARFDRQRFERACGLTQADETPHNA